MVLALLLVALSVLASLEGIWLLLAACTALPMAKWLRDDWRNGRGRQLCTDGERWWWAHRPERAGSLSQSRVWGWWVHIEWRGAGGRDEASVLVDSLPAEEFRRLRMLAAQAPLR